MMQTESKLMTLDEFFDWYPDGYGRLQPTGTHERVAPFHTLKLGIEIERLALPYVEWHAR